MSNRTYENHRRFSGSSVLKNLGLMLMGSALMSGSLVAIGAWQTGDRLLATVSSWLQNPQPAAKVDVQSIVVQQMRDASDLTTAVFTMQAVVPTSQDASLGGFVVGTTKLLYVAHGEVSAGVDLSQLSAANVQVIGSQIRVELPPPQLLDRKIDVSRSQVYDYSRGWLGLGPDVAPALQTQAQQKALETIVAAACTDGILQRASDRAKLVVTQLLKTAGYQQVSIEVPPPAACTAVPLSKPPIL